jgi:hypothetical protein
MAGCEQSGGCRLRLITRQLPGLADARIKVAATGGKIRNENRGAVATLACPRRLPAKDCCAGSKSKNAQDLSIERFSFDHVASTASNPIFGRTELESKHGVNRSGSRWAPKETTMNTSLNHGSATIYQFPVGGRDALRSHRDAPAEAVSTRASEIGFGDAWYHQEAIQSERTGKQ